MSFLESYESVDDILLLDLSLEFEIDLSSSSASSASSASFELVELVSDKLLGVEF
jgi:hypothetical protein